MNWLASRTAYLTAVAATGLLALAGCDKGTDLNVDLPETTGISTSFEEVALEGATVRPGPVPTLKANHFLAGRLRDQVTGNTFARAYLNLVAGSLNDSLPSRFPKPVLDSVVLVMPFDKVYGSATAPARFDVYGLAQKLDERRVYNSGTEWPRTAALATNVTGRLDRTIQIRDPLSPVPVVVNDQTLRLKLVRPTTPPAAGTPLADLFTALRASTTFDQARLDAALRGLALEPTAGYDGGIVSFGRVGACRMEVYFHSADVAPAKWHAYPIRFGLVNTSTQAGASSISDPRYYTQISADFRGSPLAPLADSTVAVSAAALGGVSYVQEGVGLGTRLPLRGLEALRAKLGTSGFVINRAELRLPVKPFSNGLLPSPTTLYAVEVDAAGRTLRRNPASVAPTDRIVQADGFVASSTGSPASAVLVSSANSQPYYSLLITSYLQAYLDNNLDGELPTSLVLTPTIRRSTTLTLNRSVLDADNIRLYVYYSKQ